MFAKGPQPGYSPKTEVLEQIPTSVCRKKYSICDLVGYVVYPTKKDADNDTNGIASCGSAKEAWSKALGRILDDEDGKYKYWSARLDDVGRKF